MPPKANIVYTNLQPTPTIDDMKIGDIKAIKVKPCGRLHVFADIIMQVPVYQRINTDLAMNERYLRSVWMPAMQTWNNMTEWCHLNNVMTEIWNHMAIALEDWDVDAPLRAKVGHHVMWDDLGNNSESNHTRCVFFTVTP